MPDAPILGKRDRTTEREVDPAKGFAQDQPRSARVVDTRNEDRERLYPDQKIADETF